jgi:hypothetical protein
LVLHLAPFTACRVLGEMQCMDAARPCRPAAPLLLHSGGRAPRAPHSSTPSLMLAWLPPIASAAAARAHAHHGCQAWSSAITYFLSTACPHIPPALPSPSSASTASLMTFFQPPPPLRCVVVMNSGRHSRLHTGRPPRAASGQTEAICGCAQTP